LVGNKVDMDTKRVRIFIKLYNVRHSWLFFLMW
jgi:hypothetical protein